jgi:hypothetical protein
MMILVNSILTLVAVYLFSGLCFAIPFVTRGVGKIDEGAKESGWGFRLIIIPGTIVFWPLLLRKWIKMNKGTQKSKS